MIFMTFMLVNLKVFGGGILTLSVPNVNGKIFYRVHQLCSNHNQTGVPIRRVRRLRGRNRIGRPFRQVLHEFTKKIAV